MAFLSICPAGDQVKFGLPMASSTTLLTWSLVQFKTGYERAGQLDAMYDSVRWTLDYFLEAWDESGSSLLVQVRWNWRPRGKNGEFLFFYTIEKIEQKQSLKTLCSSLG